MSMYHIATQTVTGSVAGTVTFSSIPSTFTHLQVRASVCLYHATLSGSSAFYLSSINGLVTTKAHHMYTDGSTWVGTSDSNIPIGLSYYGPSPINWGTTIIDIPNYTDTTKNKTIRGFSGWDGNGSGSIGLLSVLWANTGAINSLIFNAGGASFAIGTRFDLYGITVSGATGA